LGVQIDHSNSQPMDDKLGLWSHHVTHLKFLGPLLQATNSK